MTPLHTDPWLTVYGGDCHAVLATLPAESVHCVVTSPPYWGLRDYGDAGQLGLEPTPEQYVENMVTVFREVRRVLRSDGSLWLNLGDSYATGAGSVGSRPGGGAQGDRWAERGVMTSPNRMPIPGLKPKDLVGIPWRVAFALQADGWYLRSDIIWSKPNPMPESVTDRPTKSHEYLFLLTKSPRYYFDQEAVREAHSSYDADGRHVRAGANLRSYVGHSGAPAYSEAGSGARALPANPAGRNIRSVWTVATQPYPGAHFAVFPPKLIEPCIKAGTSERGVCAECGAPWRRVVERVTRFEGGSGKAGRTAEDANANGKWAGIQYGTNIKLGPVVDVTTTAWQPSCASALPASVAPATDATEPAIILDPFAGSGTIGLVAQRLSRRAILIDLNPAYIKQQLERNAALPLGLAG